MSRMGKHRDDKHRVQAYYTAREKAVFVLLAKVANQSITDCVKRGIFDLARRHGILDTNDMPTPEYVDRLAVETAIIEQTEKKGN